jgi:restriction system protein
MAVPDYQSLMLPLLKIAADRNEHRLSEATEMLAEQLKLSEEDRKELLSSGNDFGM